MMEGRDALDVSHIELPEMDEEKHAGGEDGMETGGKPSSSSSSAAPPREGHSSPRERWPSHHSFLLAAMGAAIGLGNLVRFPTVVQENGGGVFMVAYAVAVLLLGIPILLLEFSYGQRFQTGVGDAFKQIRPALVGVGWVMVAGSFLICSYYNMIMAWSLRFLAASFESPPPWEGRAQDYFDHTILELPRPAAGSGADPSIDDTSALVGWNVFAVTLAWALTFGAVHSGIKSSSKVVWVTVPLPFVLLLLLLVRGVTLEGAGTGIEYYLRPDMTKIFEPRVWTEAFSQIFFSISVASGVMPSFASFNRRGNNVWRDTLVVGLSNSFFSVVAGFAVFSVLGHMAWKNDTDVESVVRSGYGLAFVAFPEALATLPAASFFSVCFFLMLLTLGIDSAFALTEASINVLRDFFGRRHERRIAAGVCAAGWLTSLLYATDGGYFFLEVVDHAVATYLLLPVGLAECVAVAWVYGAAKFAGEMERDTGVKMSRRWRYLWLYVSPGLIVVAFFGALVDDIADPVRDPYGNAYPGWATAVGFFIALAPIACGVAWAVREHRRGVQPAALSVSQH